MQLRSRFLGKCQLSTLPTELVGFISANLSENDIRMLSRTSQSIRARKIHLPSRLEQLSLLGRFSWARCVCILSKRHVGSVNTLCVRCYDLDKLRGATQRAVLGRGAKRDIVIELVLVGESDLKLV